MEMYIPYLLKFAFMIFAIFPAIKHEWLAISMGVISLAISRNLAMISSWRDSAFFLAMVYSFSQNSIFSLLGPSMVKNFTPCSQKGRPLTC